MTRSINLPRPNEILGSDVNTGYIRGRDMNSSVPDEGDDQDSHRPDKTLPPDTTGLSRRRLRLAAIDGEVGSDDKAKGKVRLTALQGLEYWSEDKKDATNSTWGKLAETWSKRVLPFCSASSVPS